MTTRLSAVATAVDPDTVTAISGGFTDVKGLLTATLIPALFGLLILGIGVAVAAKYLRKGSRQA